MGPHCVGRDEIVIRPGWLHAARLKYLRMARTIQRKIISLRILSRTSFQSETPAQGVIGQPFFEERQSEVDKIDYWTLVIDRDIILVYSL